MNTLKELAQLLGYEIRNVNIPLGINESFEKVLTPFEFSSRNGGTVDSMQYYNNFYLYPTI